MQTIAVTEAGKVSSRTVSIAEGFGIMSLIFAELLSKNRPSNFLQATVGIPIQCSYLGSQISYFMKEHSSPKET